MAKKAAGKEKIGGMAFFLSIPALFLVDLANILNLLDLLGRTDLSGITWLGLGVVGGAVIAPLLGRKSEILIHEIKHAIVASLAGNKWKRLTVNKNSGAYEYSYTKKTAHLNAFISLAPYWFPLFTIPLGLLALTGAVPTHWMRIFIGVAFAIDIYSGLKDLGPHQSDLSTISGGASVATLYIILMNILTVSIILAWGIAGKTGFANLVEKLWLLGLAVYHLVATGNSPS